MAKTNKLWKSYEGERIPEITVPGNPANISTGILSSGSPGSSTPAPNPTPQQIRPPVSKVYFNALKSNRRFI